MSSGDRLSPAQFQANLDHFKGVLTQAGKAGPDTRSPGWDTPEGSFDLCYEAAHSYADRPDLPHPENMKIKHFEGFKGDVSLSHHKWVGDRAMEPSDWLHYTTGTETTEGPMAVDWTARQFDVSADFPHVEPLDEYSKRWDASGNWDFRGRRGGVSNE